MAKLTQDQINISHAWLHDVFVWGGLLQNPHRDIAKSDYRYMYARMNDTAGQQAAKTICEAIKFRPVDYKKFQDFDQALSVLADRRFMPDLHEKNYWGNRVYKKPDMLARYIAHLCAERKYYWDDSSSTTFEMDQIKQTILGNALWEYRCFVSQGKPVAAASGTTGGTRAPSTKQPGQAPQNGYKSAGPQSANVKCLIGQPNNKLVAQSPISWCIEADKIGKNTPNAFIKPLDANACPGGVANIYMGSGNGYTDCKCWFDDKQIAVNFLNQCITKFGNKFTNIHLTQKKSDANGYYEVKTEFGNCGIKASRLNEALQEAANIEAVKENIAKEIETNFDSFEEAYYKEL